MFLEQILLIGHGVRWSTDTSLKQLHNAADHDGQTWQRGTIESTVVTAPQRHSWPIPSIIPYSYSPALKHIPMVLRASVCIWGLSWFLTLLFWSRSWPLDGDQNSCILKVVPAVIFVGPNNLQPKATNGHRCKLVTSHRGLTQCFWIANIWLYRALCWAFLEPQIVS